MKTRSLITDAKGRLLTDTCLKLIGKRKNGTRCFVSVLHFSISLFLSSFSPLQAIEKAIYLLRRGCSSSRWLSRRVLLTKENGIPSIGWSHRRRIMVRSLFFAVALLLLGGWKGKDEFNDVVKLTHQIFYNNHQKRFTLEHAWKELRNDQKWCDLTSAKNDGSSKKRKCEDPADSSTYEATDSKRPPGVKAAKATGKNKEVQQHTMNEFQNMWTIREKDMAVKERMAKMSLLEGLIGRTEGLDEEEKLLKKKLITDVRQYTFGNHVASCHGSGEWSGVTIVTGVESGVESHVLSCNSLSQLIKRFHSFNKKKTVSEGLVSQHFKSVHQLYVCWRMVLPLMRSTNTSGSVQPRYASKTRRRLTVREETQTLKVREMATAAARPLVTVQGLDNDMTTDQSPTVVLPNVMTAPVRPDIVSFVHAQISNNSRQPYAVSTKSGHQTSAESWGTGRAVSRIPRVPGGGTHRAGQAAFGNQCRGGRMFAPTKVYRLWHRRVNVNMKRHAIVSAIAATAVPALVVARGHKIENVPEMPLVVSDSVEAVEKTSAAIKVLKQIGAYDDAEKAKESIGIRSGVGKMRNRRYVSRKGPLVVYGTEGSKIVKAFRNLPGVELCHVERLNLLKLAPGGHLGRFVVWTKSAFEKLEGIYGSFEKGSEKKKGYVLPRAKMVNADLARIINSDEVQSVVTPIEKDATRKVMKKNPLKNLNVMLKLNPYAKTAKRMSLLAEAERVKAKKEKLAKKRKTVTKEESLAIKAAGKSWHQTMISDSDYTDFDNFTKWLCASQ
ncbi:BnaC03g35890D [Brassica napus]|uniref:BnaC03g35890D protein n=1 Tax=Brassica napus TaxID=3708 RepID=A0A078F4H0_BRANA|nr:BnaC03g35890D [Brassica napus]